MTTLDISNTKIEILTCYQNNLNSLKISPNTKYIGCYLNKFQGESLTNLIENLPKKISESDSYCYIDFIKANHLGKKDPKENNIATKSQVELAKNKGWKLRYDNYKDYEGE